MTFAAFSKLSPVINKKMKKKDFLKVESLYDNGSVPRFPVITDLKLMIM